MLHTLRQQDSTIDSDAEFFQSNGDQLTNFIDTVANNPQGVKSFLESTNDPAFAAKLLANSKPEERPGISFLIDNRAELSRIADHFGLQPDGQYGKTSYNCREAVRFLGIHSKEISHIAHFVNAHPKEMDTVLDILEDKARKGQNPGFKDFLSHPGLAVFAVRNAGELKGIQSFVEKNQGDFDALSLVNSSEGMKDIISFSQKHKSDFPKLGAASSWMKNIAEPDILKRQDAYYAAELAKFEKWNSEFQSGNQWSQDLAKTSLENYKQEYARDPNEYQKNLRSNVFDMRGQTILRKILPDMKKSGLPIPEQIEKLLRGEKLTDEPSRETPKKNASLSSEPHPLRQGAGNLLSRLRPSPTSSNSGPDQFQIAA